MKLLKALACIASTSGVYAATLRAPIHVSRNTIATKSNIYQNTGGSISDGVAGDRRRFRRTTPESGSVRDDQHPMKDDNEHVSEEDSNMFSYTLQINHWHELTYTATLFLGTLPQPINVLLSISENDLSVPSSECSHCGNQLSYNSSKSSSYIYHYTKFGSMYVRSAFFNTLAEDTLELAGISIKNQQFGEANQVNKMFWLDWGNDEWDGVLGLAPSNHSAQLPLGLNNPFRNMADRGLIDKNLFSLRLPRGEGETGELIFGAIDESRFVGDFKTVPVIDDPDENPRTNGRWIVPATSISMGEGSASLEGYVATLETEIPFIGLPEDIVKLLHDYIGVRPRDPREPPTIDCEKRETLEDFTITLGPHDLVITAWEYILEMDDSMLGPDDGDKKCVSAFLAMPPFADNYIALGSAFLRGFYTVYDLDAKTVGFAELAPTRKDKKLGSWTGELKR